MNRLNTLKTLLGISGTSQDGLLSSYLDLLKGEIISYRYSFVGIPRDMNDIPMVYEPVLIQSIVTAYNLQGAENQTSHSENGISRNFKFSDAIDYIHAHVMPIVSFGLPHLRCEDYKQLYAGDTVVLPVWDYEGELVAETSALNITVSIDEGLKIAALSSGNATVVVKDDKHRVYVEVCVL